MSDWNLYLDRKLALDLGLEASRLADAIVRHTLGWNTRENEIGQMLLREKARLFGRSFERARVELVEAGLIRFTRGSGGRGNRDRYELLLDETAAEERAIEAETPAETPAQTPALARARREKGEVKNKTSVLPASVQRLHPRAGWPEGLGRRTIDDLDAACSLVEDLQSGRDRHTLRAFVVDELTKHDAADFDYVADELAEKRRTGIGNPPQPIKSEAAFARSILRDIRNGYELRAPR